MALRVYNTLTRTLEPFEPLVPGQVRMYVCGVTVYDLCHIGHARSALAFEVARRYLEYLGYRVTFVRNFTDVDDKIIVRARERNMAWDALAREFIAAFHADMDALGIRRADVEPKATDHIPEMLAIIGRLVERGLAYAMDGDVYFAVRGFQGYGKLSHRSPDDLQAGARIEVDERKRDPLDFALWKASRPGEPTWDSPWGPGRPGWHIECSAMSAKYLGDTFDIHAGGEDLIFPHHENEIAQSEGASGRPFARYWLHNGFVTVGGEKMAKSLGNFVTIRDALRRFPADALKLLLVSTNYRGPLDYTETAVAEKGKALQGFQEFLRAVEFLRAETGRAGGAAASAPTAHPAEEAFRAAMDDDFNTARATGVLFDLVREGNRMLQEVRGAGEPSPSAVAALEETAALLTRLGSVLALDFAGATADVSTASAVTLTRSADEAVGELTRLLAAPAALSDGTRRRTHRRRAGTLGVARGGAEAAGVGGSGRHSPGAGRRRHPRGRHAAGLPRHLGVSGGPRLAGRHRERDQRMKGYRARGTSPEADLVIGPHAALEVLRAGKRTVRRLTLARQEGGATVEAILDLARRQKIPVETRTRDDLDRVVRGATHQGVLLEVGTVPLRRARDAGGPRVGGTRAGIPPRSGWDSRPPEPGGHRAERGGRGRPRLRHPQGSGGRREFSRRPGVSRGHGAPADRPGDQPGGLPRNRQVAGVLGDGNGRQRRAQPVRVGFDRSPGPGDRRGGTGPPPPHQEPLRPDRAHPLLRRVSRP